MLPKFHILIGFVFSYLISIIFNLTFPEFAIIFLSSWLFIDLDHCLEYVWTTRNFSPIKFWNYSIENGKKRRALKKEEKRKYKQSILIFHGVEFLILLIILSFFNKIFLFVFLGFTIHLVLDYIDLNLRQEIIYNKISLIYTLISNKNKKTLT